MAETVAPGPHPSAPARERAALLDRLSTQGGRVLYRCVDVQDAGALARVVEEVEREWQRFTPVERIGRFVVYFAVVLAIVAGVLEFASVKALVMVGSVYGLGQVFEGFYLTPRLVGERIGLHPLAVIFALLFGAASLRAEVRPAAACSDPFANGSCTTTTQCAKYCQGVGAGTGSCSSGCCWCIWF